MSKYEPLKLAETASIATRAVRLSALPKGYVLRKELGLVTREALDGQVVHRTLKPVVFGASGLLLETRANKTPGGDYLLMFVEGEHYGAHPGRVSDMLAHRSEIWFATSRDEGQTWSEPRFLFSNAAYPDRPNSWHNNQCSYLDMFVDEGVLNIFCPHRWQQALHLHIREADLAQPSTREQLR